MKRWILILLVIAIVIVVDQISKQLVLDNLEIYESYQPIPALSEVFQFTRTSNTGAAFGLLSNASNLFLVVAVMIVAGMLYFYPRVPQEAVLTQVAMGMVCGGALGNVLDRLQHGYVVDFIHYRIPNVLSNVSNLADHAIVLGVLLIIFDSWWQERKAATTPELPYNDDSTV